MELRVNVGMAASMQFLSSRTLPGQKYCIRTSRVLSATAIGSPLNRWRDVKCAANSGISRGRSRSGGSTMCRIFRLRGLADVTGCGSIKHVVTAGVHQRYETSRIGRAVEQHQDLHVGPQCFPGLDGVTDVRSWRAGFPNECVG